MSAIKNILSSMQTFLQDHHLSFSNGILILLTIGGEQIFQATVFSCPCEHPQAEVYGLVLLFMPAILLIIIGIAVSNLTWRVLHGCCYRSKGGENVSQTDQSIMDLAPGGSIKEDQEKNPDETTVKDGQGRASGGQAEGAKENPQLVRSHEFYRACWNLSIVLSRSLIAPIAWLCLSLLDGRYYVCIRSNDPCKIDSEDYKKWKSESQIISWCLLLGVAVFSFIVISITRCMDSVTYVQYRYIRTYREAEECQIDCHLTAKSREKAGEKIQVFMQKGRQKEDWDAISLVPDLSGPSLSALDNWYEMLPPREQKIQLAAQEDQPRVCEDQPQQ